MKVKDVMTSQPVACASSTPVAAAAELMLTGDCGILPVVRNGKLVGVVTDRDLFIALCTRDARASELTVGDVAGTSISTCGPDDDVQTALDVMKRQQIRRLPVTGRGGTLLGIVSMNDVLLAAGPANAISGEEVIEALQAICTHRQSMVHV